jgi:hypothetical protein
MQIRTNFQLKIKGSEGAVSRLAENCLGMKVCNSRDAINSKYSNNGDASKGQTTACRDAIKKAAAGMPATLRTTFYS